MKIVKVSEIDEKRKFLDLLLLADEQENMIEKYLGRGELFALYDEDLKTVCIVSDEGNGVFEIQNLATYEKEQGRGYGRKMIEYVCGCYGDKGSTMFVGTGDSPLTVPFYEHCGFSFSHRIKDYMLEHYDNPIIENGVQLFDKVYLKREL